MSLTAYLRPHPDIASVVNNLAGTVLPHPKTDLPNTDAEVSVTKTTILDS